MTQIDDSFVGIATGGPFDDFDALGVSHDGLHSAISGVMQAYRDEGFAAGYARATSDLLADFVLIAEQFIHELPAEKRSALRPVLRAFENHLAVAVHSRKPVEVFVDGGLGI